MKHRNILVIALLLVFQGFITSSAFADTWETVKNGSWADASTWNRVSGTDTWKNYPQYDDVVTIKHAVVNYNTGYSGGMIITSAGSLKGSATFQITANNPFTNNGTLEIGKFLFNGNTTTITNNGTAIFSDNLDLDAGRKIINNGTLTFKGTFSNQGTITGSGNFIVLGSLFKSDEGKLTIDCGGSLNIHNDVQLNGGTIEIGNATCTSDIIANITGKLDINKSGNKIATFTNYGNLTIGSPSSMKTVIINAGKFLNYGRSHLYADLTMNSGSKLNEILNEGMFIVEKTLYSHMTSYITNNDSMIINQLSNGSIFTNSAGSFLQVGDFLNTSKAKAIFKNDGIMLVTGDFTNDWNAIFTGNGGATKVRGLSTNRGVMSGNQDFCDSSTSSVDTGPGTYGSGITNCLVNALPVKLVRFTAERSNNMAILKWQTASELNNSHFEVYKSNDGRKFIKIGQVEGHGTTNDIQNYTFNDNNIGGGDVTYYRLKQVDFNGDYENSPIVSLKKDANGNYGGLNLYPNPLGQQKLNVSFNANSEGMATIEIISMDGNRVFFNAYPVASGNNSIQIDLDNAPTGLYVIRVSDGIDFMSSKFRK